MQFVEVVWQDAWCDDDNFSSAHGIAMTHKPMRVETRGWLVIDDDHGVSVASERSVDVADGSEVFRGRTFIPRPMIASVTPYKLTKPRRKRAVAPPSTPPTDSNTEGTP